jgi:hypothetical protein
MCCFSQPVVSVSATKIFARPESEGRQFLVYSMSIEARKELAMILPLPVRLPADENDVEFIDLKGYPQFFSDLERGFPRPLTKSTERHSWGISPAPASAAPLAVVTVGDFEASFVPAVKDFSRLDARFRIADDVWKKLPGYTDYSFAVFKLKPGALTVHPMAFSFPRRDPRTVFFPTVHIHDGKVHEKADFDHTIYCQPRREERLSIHNWEESYTHALGFMQMGKTKGIVLPDQHCYKRGMHGSLANRDTFLAVEA